MAESFEVVLDENDLWSNSESIVDSCVDDTLVSEDGKSAQL